MGITESCKLEKRLFSAADVTALPMGLGWILSGGEVADALAKVPGRMPEEQRRKIGLKACRLAVDMTPWVDRGGGPDVIGTIHRAMDESRLPELDYVDRMGQPGRRMVEPYRLLLGRMRWYLGGCRLEREDFRRFKPTRMIGLSPTGDCFLPGEPPGCGRKAPIPGRRGRNRRAVPFGKSRGPLSRRLRRPCIGEPCKDGFRAAVSLLPGPPG